MDPDQQHLASTLHTFFCNDTHEDDMMKLRDRKNGVCYWYLEDQIGESWRMVDHVRYSNMAEGFKESIGASDFREAQEIFDKVLEHCSALNELGEHYPNISILIEKLLLNTSCEVSVHDNVQPRSRKETRPDDTLDNS